MSTKRQTNKQTRKPIQNYPPEKKKSATCATRIAPEQSRNRLPPTSFDRHQSQPKRTERGHPLVVPGETTRARGDHAPNATPQHRRSKRILDQKTSVNRVEDGGKAQIEPSKNVENEEYGQTPSSTRRDDPSP
jgi:hypothetical protein